jgi:hypothetical protein
MGPVRSAELIANLTSWDFPWNQNRGASDRGTGSVPRNSQLAASSSAQSTPPFMVRPSLGEVANQEGMITAPAGAVCDCDHKTVNIFPTMEQPRIAPDGEIMSRNRNAQAVLGFAPLIVAGIITAVPLSHRSSER